MARSINVTWVPRVVPLDAIFSGLLYGQPGHNNFGYGSAETQT